MNTDTIKQALAEHAKGREALRIVRERTLSNLIIEFSEAMRREPAGQVATEALRAVGEHDHPLVVAALKQAALGQVYSAAYDVRAERSPKARRG